MNVKIVAVLLVVFIIGGCIGYALSMPSTSKLQAEISSLRAMCQNLDATNRWLRTRLNESALYYEEVIESLNAELSSLQTGYDSLNRSHSQLDEEYQWLQANYTCLNNTYNQLVGVYRHLQNEYSYLNLTFYELLKAYEDLNKAAAYEVHVLTGQDYYYSLKDALRMANGSVLVAMYSMVYDLNDTEDWANDLITELVNAKNRGANVTVILEYRTYFGYMEENLAAYDYLRSSGVNVMLDDEPDTDHLKLVVINDHIVYIGSYNWSESALCHNRETSLKIISGSIARTLIEYVEANHRQPGQ